MPVYNYSQIVNMEFPSCGDGDVILRLAYTGNDIQLRMVDCFGETRAVLLIFDKHGKTTSASGAEQRLKNNGHDASMFQWDDNGALDIIDEREIPS